MSRIFGFFILILSVSAHAVPELSVFAGVRGQSANVGQGIDTHGNDQSFQAGVKAANDLQDSMQLISGLGITQRKMGFVVNDQLSPAYERTGSFEFTHLEVPLHLNYQWSDSFSTWAGPTISYHLSSKCTLDSPLVACSKVEEKDWIIPLSFGLRTEITGGVGFEVFFETTTNSSGLFGEFAKDLKGYRSLGLNLLYSF